MNGPPKRTVSPCSISGETSFGKGPTKEEITMNYPNTVTMDGEEKTIVTWNLKGIARWVVFDEAVLVDPNYLGELFSLELCLV